MALAVLAALWLTPSGLGLVATITVTTVADVNGNLVRVDPLLGPLTNSGGPTQTIALLPGSPAISAGDPERYA